MFVDPKKHIDSFLLGEGMKVIDLGSGVGHFALPAAARVGKHGEVIAVDIQSSLLSKLLADAKAEGHHHIHVVHADLDDTKKTGKKKIGIKENYADRILLINTLFQIQEKISLLEEAKDLLKEGGALVLVDWHPKKGAPWKDEHLMTAHEARTLLDKAGYDEVLEIDLPHHHYGFIARKRIKKAGVRK